MTDNAAAITTGVFLLSDQGLIKIKSKNSLAKLDDIDTPEKKGEVISPNQAENENKESVKEARGQSKLNSSSKQMA